MIKTIGTLDGQPVREATLQSGPHRVCILNYGCVVRQWQLQLPGEIRELVLGFEQFADYPQHSRSFGIIAGRVANRTCNGQFTLNGQHYQLAVNNGAHHLHGGVSGLGRRLWQMDINAAATQVQLTYHSPDGEEGYPSHVAFTVTYSLDAEGLRCDMQALPDRPTPVNLAQHNYYNLDGGGTILDHTLQLHADRYMPVDAGLIPTGELTAVAGTRFDFRQPGKIADVDTQALGYDHNMVLAADRDPALPAATLVSSDKQVALRLYTQEPGVQLFTAAALDVAVPGLRGFKYGRFGGICLEAQHHPDSLNHSQYPSIICTPDQPYAQALRLNITDPDTQAVPFK